MENRDRASHLVKVVELEHVRPSLRGPSDKLGCVDLSDE